MAEHRLGSLLSTVPLGLSRLTNDAGYTKVIVSQVAVNRWLPGSIDLFTEEFFKAPKDLPPGEVVDVADNLALPADIPAGRYGFSLAVVNETAKPVVRLGIKGRAEDGWYPLSKLTVK